MTDLVFDLKYIPNRYEDRVQRAAVLYPLTKKCNNADQIRTQIGLLQLIWRARVGALTNLGWAPRGDSLEHSIIFARNCLPAFAYSTPRSRPCHNRSVCPFCYARWVRGVWLTVDQAFSNPKELNSDNVDHGVIHDYPDDDNGLPQPGVLGGCDPLPPIPEEPKRKTVYKHHAVELIHDYVKKSSGDPRHEVTFLSTLFSELTEIRRCVVKYIQPSAAFIYDTVAPVPGGWRVRSRHLLRIDPGQTLPDVYGSQSNTRLTRHEEPSRRVLFGAVARVCRYPVQLIRGDPGRTLLLLGVKQSQRLRASAAYRGFRTRTQY